jgi:hypothetical protein
MDRFARENRASEYAGKIVATRWMYLHGNRDEHAEKEIYHLYDEVKKVMS